MILGVSEWLGAKIGMQTQHVRIAFLLLLILAGTGVLLYLVLWLVKTLSK
ncbi:PspC domain-containing protein [Pseudotenacibaculum sp. MALMAid0570]